MHQNLRSCFHKTKQSKNPNQTEKETPHRCSLEFVVMYDEVVKYDKKQDLLAVINISQEKRKNVAHC